MPLFYDCNPSVAVWVDIVALVVDTEAGKVLLIQLDSAYERAQARRQVAA